MTAYHDLDDPQAMSRDAARVSLAPPVLRYDEFPTDLAKPRIEVSDAARRISDALGLSLD